MPRGRRGGRRGRPSAISAISTMDLHRELERRQSMLQELIRQRDALDEEVRALGGGGIMSAGSGGAGAVGRPRRGRPPGSGARRGPGRPRGSAAGGSAGRARNPNSLVETLRRVLSGSTLSVTNAADAVKKAGYSTSSSNFRVIVNQALLANPKIFKKVARGEYTAR